MMPANNVFAGTPPIVIVTGFARSAAVFSWPTVLGGVVGPNPVPNKSMVSPGLAGTVKTPEMRLAGPM